MDSPDPNTAAETDALGDPRFLLLLDTLPYISFVVATGGRAAYYNARFVEYLGFMPGPARGDRTALHHPDDRAALTAAREAGVAAETDYVVEVRLRRHDGAYRWHRIHNKPLFQDGRRVAYLGTAVDIHEARTETERLEERVRERTAALTDGEAKYRELYNRTPMALHSSDASARLVDVNDTWLALFGYARADVLGRSPTEFMTPDSALVYRQRAWPGMLASGGAVRVMDYQFATKDGRVFDGRLSARGVFDDAGRLMRTWAAIADVTAEKQADRALRQSQRMDAIGQLTAGVAHDFNNLLTAILGSLELAARPGQNEPGRLRLIAGARTAAERGARLTAQLLAFSRQQRIVAGPVDVGGVVQGMAALLADTAGAAIAMVVEPAPPGLPLALADATQLELAILNLVINARDALAGPGRIVVAIREATAGPPRRPEDPEPGDYVAIDVRDTGPGMTEAVRDRMFEPFFTTKGAGRGSGLGLAQVLGIAKQLGGGVRVRTAPGEGTSVCLFLPRAEGAGHLAAASPDAAGPAACDPCAVLLVDDDPDVRGTAAALLRAAGHDVTEAGSGAAALGAMDGGRFDLVLADIAMPEMDGVQLAGRLRARWPGVPVLFMTGYADEAILPEGAWGAVLRKPFSAAALEAAVARAVAGPA